MTAVYGLSEHELRSLLELHVDGRLPGLNATPESDLISVDLDPRVVCAAVGESRCTRDGESLAEALLREGRERGVQIAAAESCTGGLFGAELTAVPGSSDVFWGTLVTYSYDAKVQVLGVARETLEARGAVSEDVVLEMARGVWTRSGAGIAVAISGIAGPGGGTPEKPVGTVWLACVTQWAAPQTKRLLVEGDRARVRRRSVTEGLVLMRAALVPA